MNAILKSTENLGAHEKLQLVEDLWDSIETTSVPVMNDAIYEELGRRASAAVSDRGLNQSIESVAKALNVRL
jgi:putative addiction module component (TIGR02574 family)